MDSFGHGGDHPMRRWAIVVVLGAGLLFARPAVAGDRPAAPTVAPIVRVLDVSKVDKAKQQVLFYQTAEVRETIDEGGRKVARVRYITVGAAFSLRAGKAMTAGGKALGAD